MPSKINDWRLRIDLHVIKNQQKINTILRIYSLLISISTIVSIVIYYGFPIEASSLKIFNTIVYGSFIYYIFQYFIHWFYSIHRWQYLKESKFDFLITILLIIHFLYLIFAPSRLNILQVEKWRTYYILFVQFYFFIIVLMEISKMSDFMNKITISPPKLMLFSFLFLIFAGTGLLLLPEMSRHGIRFIDALFTATSASCVTGLTVINIGSDFTIKGQIVILILIQLGGMSILSFATFFTAIFSKNNTGLRYQHLVKDLLSTNKLSDSFILLKEIVLASILIELIGSALLFMYWKNTATFQNTDVSLFYAVFHSISAFNNAGFSLWNSNLMDIHIVNSYFPQTIIMLLVFMGGIGFLTLSDFFHPHYIRMRKQYKWKTLMPGSQITLITTALLILFGTVIFFLVEYKHSLALKDSWFSKAFAALFQIVTTRTAGFNTINAHHLALPGIMILLLLMFIGASPGSTGGGIKTTTFFVLIKSVFATIRGKARIEFHKKTIPFEIVDKSYSIIMMSLILIFVSTFILTLVEPDVPFRCLIFETISAFSTSGLSTGVIFDFDVAGKFILIVNMYIGRIGTLTLAFALSKRINSARHEYPSTYFMVG